MNMPKSRDIQAKMSSPKVILYTFWLVTVKVLNSYKGKVSGRMPFLRFHRMFTKNKKPLKYILGCRAILNL